jgi:hypothetical protein
VKRWSSGSAGRLSGRVGRRHDVHLITVHRPSIPAFAALVPYVVAIVEFEEGPRLPGILLGERGPGVAIRQRVQGELIEVPGAAPPALAFRRQPA